MAQLGTTGLMNSGVNGMMLGIPVAHLLAGKMHKGISEELQVCSNDIGWLV